MTTIRQAILQAADHIEKNPCDFNFYSVDKPECGTPGCALGWIGVFMGIEERRDMCWVGSVHRKIGVDSSEFYSRMSGIDNDWSGNAKTCARTLRLYADKYHPTQPIAPKALPKSVTDIFSMSPEQLFKELAS